MSGVTAGVQASRSQSPSPTPSPESLLGAARNGLLQRKCACGGTLGVDGECETCREEAGGLQRRAAGPGGQAKAPPIVNDVLRSPGQPLNTPTRAFFEPRFGHDFSKVRVHDDSRAAASVRAVNALAYTVGSDIVFGAGHYAPHTASGRLLIAHELTHVVQQQSVSTDLRRAISIGSSTTFHEQEADCTASRMTNPGPGAGREGTVDPQPLALPEVSRLAAGDAPLQRKVMGDTYAPGTTGGLGLMDSPSGGVYGPAGGSRGRSSPSPSQTPAAPKVASPPQAAPPAKDATAAAGPTKTPGDQATQAEPPDAKGTVGSASATASAPAEATPPPAGGKPADGKGAGAVTAAAAPAATGVDGTTEGPEAEAGEGATVKKTPGSPHDDPDFRAVAGRVNQAATKQKAHAPAGAKAKEAQAAAVSPPAELKGRASAVQAAAIDRWAS
jgi:Domain of unknown function (DUF4157)